MRRQSDKEWDYDAIDNSRGDTMNKIKLKTEAYISLYAELAERRLEAFEFAEYRQEEEVDVFVKNPDGSLVHSEWASDQFVEECNVIKDILISHGIIQEI